MVVSLLRVVPLVALCLIAVPLSGCFGVSDEQPSTPGLPFDPEALRFPTTYYFSDARGLSEAEPFGDTKAEPLGDFYTRWAVGSGFPEWVSKPVDEPLLVTGTAELEFWVTAESVVTSTPGIFPDFVVYFGTSESVLAVESPTNLQPVAGDFSVIQSGDAVPVRASFELPPGGITVPRSAALRVITAPVMMESEPADLLVLYGSQKFPSRVSFNVTYLSSEPWVTDDSSVSTKSHQLPAGSFLHGQEVAGVNILEVPVEVSAETEALLVDLDFTGSTPFPDMDLYVFAPDGTPMGLSVTPGADEAVHLYPRNLAEGGPGTWTIKVVNYVTPSATFDLTVATYG